MASEIYKESEVRQKIIEAIRRDLLGPSSDEEILYGRPNIEYLTGMLTPDMQENYSPSGDIGSLSDMNAKHIDEEEELADEDEGDVSKSPLIKSTSIGLSFYVAKNVKKISVNASWGEYFEKKEQEAPDELFEDDDETNEVKDKKIKEKLSYHRVPHKDQIDIDLNNMSAKVGTFNCFSDNGVIVTVIKYDLKNNYSFISVYLCNRKNISGNVEDIMFQAKLQIFCDEGFVSEADARNNSFEDEYFYKEKPIFARGRGCAAIWTITDGLCKSVETEFIPECEINAVSADFEEFKDNPTFFSTLKYSNYKMKDSNIRDLKLLASKYQEWIETLKINPKKSLFKNKMDSFNAIIKKCQNAHDRILEGIITLENDDVAYKAFCVMNQTIYLQNAIKKFSKKHGSGIECDFKDFSNPKLPTNSFNWRPFQLAFILLNLNGIVYPTNDERKIVDLLYFPTGGGKTEAYLGLMSFTIFNRRLRKNDSSEYNRDGGVTIILRYTLRLLTTQQRDRLTKMIIAAEYIRNQNPAVYGEERISIGFWVGDGVVSNSFNDFVVGKDGDETLINKAKIRASKQITTCPHCGNRLMFKPGASENEQSFSFDIEKQELKIYCLNKKCVYAKYPENGHSAVSLPVYLIDEEIYNKCPTIVLGTVDKFAKLPWDVRTNSIFGRVHKKCERHGFISISDYKHAYSHQATKNLPKSYSHDVKKFLPPELIVQDELHLITGPLGTIYGGYETMIEKLCSYELDGHIVKPKYIVSTATIKNAGEQIKSLYARNHFQFPPAGLDSGDSYFIREIPREVKPFRKYIGICANGQSMKTTLLRTFAATLQEVKNLSNDPNYLPYIDPYYTLVGYFNSIRELGGAARLIDDDIPKRIKRICKMHKIDDKQKRILKHNREITSRINSDEIKKELDLLEVDSTNSECVDTAIATNMIAVGMDVDRLGLMCVLGQPKQNSEYIQATSRIGRSHLGLVLSIYNPYRPRDLSHYENFIAYHTQMYRYVEGTTATPFAARARDRFLHALVVTAIRLYYPDYSDRAKEINSLSQSEIDKITKDIIQRVNLVDPKAVTDTKEEIKHFIDEWKRIAGTDKDVVYSGKYSENKIRIMVPYSEEKHDEEKSTLQSMREVDNNSGLYIYEGE